MRKWSPETIKKENGDKSEESSISLIDRTANILISLGKGINNITDIADHCNLSKSTVHRLLNALTGPRLTVYDSNNHRYYLGPLITQLAANSEATHQYLIMCAADEIKQLARKTEETVALNLMVGLNFIRLYNIPSNYSLKVEEATEKEPLLPLGSLHKVLFAELNEKELKLALRSLKVWSTENHFTYDLDRLTSELVQIRKQGYAVSLGERIPGGIGISVPIRNYFCPVALSILGPESRLQANLPRLINELKSSASRLSTDIAEIFRK